MKKKTIIIFNLVVAIIFASLFYKNHIGINLLLFELLVVPSMLYINRPVRFNSLLYCILAGVITSSIMTVIINTNWCIFINIIFILSLSTALSFQGFRSVLNLGIETAFRFVLSQFSFSYNWNSISKSNITPEPSPKAKVKVASKKKNNISQYFTGTKLLYVVVLPLAITLLFIILYSQANLIFYAKFRFLIEGIYDFIRRLDFLFVVFILLGFVIGNHLFMKTMPMGLYQTDLKGELDLRRKKKAYFSHFKKTGLKTLCLSGVVILACLNILILYFNILDITYIWFGFNWSGYFLKEFVHEGTWVLVFCIFISSGIALYFFKGNLNFFSKNKTLKLLTIIWISQNMLMCISVIIRNYWYIHYFGLAYKRIAVLFFLLLTLIGLASIIYKLINKKTSFFLWKVNSISLTIILIISSCVNWDTVIAKFNFKHYNRSLIEYPFISSLNDSSLPYTQKTSQELEAIRKAQKSSMPFDTDYLWESSNYQDVLDRRINTFINNYENRNWLEWNLADYRTYKKLGKNNIHE